MSASPQRRTLQERIEAIFEFIERQPGTFPKSRLKEIGLNPSTAGKWLELIEFIQSQPKIRLIKTGHNTLIEKVEGKYQALMRKMVTDESVGFEDRLQYSTDYLRSLYAREKVDRTDFISHTPRKHSLETILDSLNIYFKLDQSFERFIHIFQQVEAVADENEKSMELSKRVKKFMTDINIQADLKRVLDDPLLTAKIQDIELQDPTFGKKAARARKILYSAFQL